MSSDQLKCNIPGCQHNLHEFGAALQVIEAEKHGQSESYRRMAEEIQGAGMDEATAYSMELNSAITGIHATVHAMMVATSEAMERTIAYDANAGAQMTGSGH